MSRVRFVLAGLLCMTTALSAASHEAVDQKPDAASDKAANGKPAMKPHAAKDGQVFTSPNGYSLEIPEGWEYGVGLMGADLFAIAPPPEDNVMGAANFNVMVGESDGLTLDEFYNSSMEGLKAIVDGLKIDESGDMKLGGLPAKWHLYTYPHYNSNLKVLQYVAIDGPTVFVVTFTTSEKDYKKYEPTFKKVVESFKLVEKSEAKNGKEAAMSFQPMHQGMQLSKLGLEAPSDGQLCRS